MADFNYGTMVPYLFFKKVNDDCITVRADKLIMIRKKSANTISMIFEGTSHAHFEMIEVENAAPGATDVRSQLIGNIEIKLSVVTGKGDEVSKAIIRGINLPVSVGDPRSTYDRGFITIADAISSTYIDALITDVHSINVDLRYAKDQAGGDLID